MPATTIVKKVLVIVGRNKGLALREIVHDDVLSQGHNALITDFNGELWKHFTGSGRQDEVLRFYNPFPPGRHYLDEIGDSRDAIRMSYRVVPESEDIDASQWQEYSRTYLEDMTRELGNVHRRWRQVTMAELYQKLLQPISDEKLTDWKKFRKGFRKFLLRTVRRVRMLSGLEKFLLPHEDVDELLHDTRSERFFRPENSRVYSWIRAAAAMSLIRYMHRQECAHPAVAEWIKQSSERKTDAGNILFVPYEDPAEQSLLLTWITIAMHAVMKMERFQVLGLRLILDGLDRFERIPYLMENFMQVQESGAQLILGVEDLDRFKQLYGKEAEIILNDAEIWYV